MNDKTPNHIQHQVARRELSEREVRSLNYSPGNLFRYFTSSAFVDVEIADEELFICNSGTNPEERRKGHATAILIELSLIAKPIVVGCYSDDGERYLKPLIEKINANCPICPASIHSAV